MSGFLQARSGAPLFVQIAAGVSLGILLASVVIWQTYEWRARRAAEELAAGLGQAAARAAEQQRQQIAVQARLQVQQRSVAASAQRAEEARKRQVLEATERRQEAWVRFYRKPGKCEESRGGSWTVDCANEFMRAKRAFDEAYAAGKL